MLSRISLYTSLTHLANSTGSSLEIAHGYSVALFILKLQIDVLVRLLWSWAYVFECSE